MESRVDKESASLLLRQEETRLQREHEHELKLAEVEAK